MAGPSPDITPRERPETLPAAPVRLFRRVLAVVRRASAAVYRFLVLVLLAIVYVVVLPWFAVGLRLRARRPRGFRRREDGALTTLARLRSPF
jgi:hypothetical protein